MGFRSILFAAVLLGLLAGAGCSSRKPRPFLLPLLPALERPQPEPIDPPAPPILLTRLERLPPWPFQPKWELPEPPEEPKAADVKPSRPAAPVKPEPPVLSEAPAEVPQLGRLLTPEERFQHDRTITENLGRARERIRNLQPLRLTAVQRDALERIRSFIDQAEEARNADLLRALNLSVRATVLADDLSRSIR